MGSASRRRHQLVAGQFHLPPPDINPNFMRYSAPY
jgi:hypothetical protein